MSLDRSLRTKNALIRHRNVLKRDERIALLKEQEKWDDAHSMFGLPKVSHRKVATKKAPKIAAEGVPGAVGAAVAPGAAGAAAPAAAAPAAKGAKGAKGAKAGAAPAAAKGAAPAAKGEAKPAAKGKK
jgi:small basic protein (TIGR04137 family)